MHANPGERFGSLTNREVQGLIDGGATNADIAALAGLAHGTVKSYLRRRGMTRWQFERPARGCGALSPEAIQEYMAGGGSIANLADAAGVSYAGAHRYVSDHLPDLLPISVPMVGALTVDEAHALRRRGVAFAEVAARAGVSEKRLGNVLSRDATTR